MNSSEAGELVKQHVKGEFLLKHMYATEAIMKSSAQFLSENAEMWALCGLLHDIDFEKTKENPVMHGVLAQELLKGKGIPDDVLRAILAHNSMIANPVARETKMEHILVAADSMTGLIIACAMVKGKKIDNVSEDSVKNAFKKKGFAAGSKRENIMECENAGIPYDLFVEISLKAMKEIAEKLSL
ncbi:MAG: HDIG domain-containing metalloprotein [Nanoarchaeota archaeon]|nr:HDIG domain-containing protein [Nanoarchaeota archaeon]MBU4300841.1 HDIG domain-containing protein [Nanoarchaeota archaeon]MBU4452014.1 HDIG domain-containing protein [Nanoarchaeota archaeon]MCG2724473.1 HDIG domain-containing protein [archaeon]